MWGARAATPWSWWGGSLIWVDQKNVVRKADTVPQAVSDNALAEIISGAQGSELRAWSFTRDEHTYYVLRVGDAATWALDDSTTLWAPWASKGLTYFRAHLGADVSGTVLAADSDSAAIWQVSSTKLSDVSDEIVRRCIGYLSLKEGVAPCNTVTAIVDQGVGLISGQGSDPQLLLSISKDLGKTFGAQEAASLGAEGATTTRTRWRPGGTIRAPGWMFMVECSDPIRLRLTDLRLNAA
jgi:hypothetical protein